MDSGDAAARAGSAGGAAAAAAAGRRAGRFITFEGIDGAGKSTHIGALAAHLRSAGHDVLLTREPGGTPLAERLRDLVLQLPMDALTETMLVFAARRDHVVQVIVPALRAGRTVLCDRFSDATYAYQGGGRGFDTRILATLEDWVHPGLQPDLTIWFDLPVAVAAARRAAHVADRFERQDRAFFTAVRDGYLARQRAAPCRFARIDASADMPAVSAAVVAAVASHPW